MFPARRTIVGLLATSLMLPGCQSPPPRTVITLAAHGQEITVPLGARIEIQLPRNASTGFQWIPEDAPTTPILTLIQDTTSPETPQNGALGSGGERHLAYEATATGYEVVAWSYRRPWLDASDSDRRFTVVISVDGDADP